VRNGNLVCSPLSLDIVLGMLAVRAEGDILKQLLGFLRQGIINHILFDSPSAKLLAQSISNPNSGLESTLANVKLSQAVEEINSWVKKETKGLIESVVKTSDFKVDDFMVLANVSYFKGEWHKQFKAQSQGIMTLVSSMGTQFQMITNRLQHFGRDESGLDRGIVEGCFKPCPKKWSLEILRKELERVLRMFRECLDHKGKKIHLKAGDLIRKHDNKVISSSDLCVFML
nr:hypothetical protein [Tanacetum cinerariifolium]